MASATGCLQQRQLAIAPRRASGHHKHKYFPRYAGRRENIATEWTASATRLHSEQSTRALAAFLPSLRPAIATHRPGWLLGYSECRHHPPPSQSSFFFRDVCPHHPQTSSSGLCPHHTQTSSSGLCPHHPPPSPFTNTISCSGLSTTFPTITTLRPH